ncbi:Uncharacterised protein [Mycobacteroides abscessus subsp. massiliense]|nr:Uncharacterised protein [Mycobacteroides abscessus subsp. massiliense]
MVTENMVAVLFSPAEPLQSIATKVGASITAAAVAGSFTSGLIVVQ